jgi:hypothetical protein
MEFQMRNSSGSGPAGTGGSSPDPQCRMVEHIVTHYNADANYVRNVMNERKAGYTGQPAILNMIRNVITKY